MSNDTKILKITQSKPCIKSTEDIRERAKMSLGCIEDLVDAGQMMAAAAARLGFMIQDWDDMPGVNAMYDLAEALDYIFKKIDHYLPDLKGGIEALVK